MQIDDASPKNKPLLPALEMNAEQRGRYLIRYLVTGHKLQVESAQLEFMTCRS